MSDYSKREKPNQPIKSWWKNHRAVAKPLAGKRAWHWELYWFTQIWLHVAKVMKVVTHDRGLVHGVSTQYPGDKTQWPYLGLRDMPTKLLIFSLCAVSERQVSVSKWKNKLTDCPCNKSPCVLAHETCPWIKLLSTTSSLVSRPLRAPQTLNERQPVRYRVIFTRLEQTVTSSLQCSVLRLVEGKDLK